MQLKTRVSFLILSFLSFSFDAIAYPQRLFDRDSHGFLFGISGLYWQASTPNSDYALTFANVTTASGDNWLSDNNYHSVVPGYEWYYQLFVGYNFGARDDVRLTYTNFNDSAHSRTIRLDSGSLLPTLTNTWPRTAAFNIGEVDITAVIPTPPFVLNFTVPSLPLQLIAPSSITLNLVPDFATARTNFKQSALDLTLGKTIRVRDNWELRWYEGLRYAHISQALDTDYFATGTEQATQFGFQHVVANIQNGFLVIDVQLDISATETTTVNAEIHEIFNQKSDFDGIGPYAGFDASYYFNYGLGIKSSVAASLLIGNTSSSAIDVFTSSITADTEVVMTPFNPNLGIDAVILSTPADNEPQIISTQTRLNYPNDIRIVPNIDVKLALTYDFPLSNFRSTHLGIEAGWVVSHYFNPIDRLALIDAQSPENRARKTLDTNYQGPYVSVCVYL